MKEKAKQLKKQIVIVYLAYMHKDVKWYIKAFLLIILIYAVSPIDIIPDFIPVLGLLDDIILIPAGILLAIKMIPKSIWEECRKKAESGVTIDDRYKKIGSVFIITIWVIIIALIINSLI